MPTPDPSPRNRGRTPGASRVVLVNKPYGVLCQFTSASGRATLRDIVPIRHVYPAGRLDADSEGLVVLTGDGAMQARIAHPRHKLAKRYYVQVEGEPSQAQLDRLARGVDLGDFVTRPANVGQVAEPEWLWPRDPPIRVRKSIPTAWLAIDLVEGRNRQVRRMTAAVGLPTLRLVRWSVGPWSIAELVPGTWRFAPATLPATAPTGQAPSAPPRGRARKTRVL